MNKYLKASTMLVLSVSTLQAQPVVHPLEVLSQTYAITRKYKSMEGPSGTQQIVLLKDQPPQLVWITGFHTQIVDEDGKTPSSSEFMCHINLDTNITEHGRLFGWMKNTSPRLFTLSQAQFDVDFPEGFGMPVMSNETFSLTTQVLNHNFENPNFKVRHKVTVDFVLDKDLKEPMKPLFATNAFEMRLIEGKSGNYGIADNDVVKHGPSCLPGLHAPAAGQSALYPDQFGRKFSGHWVVPPGREKSHTNVTKIMNLPFDTTVHYINIHLHPFAESLELKDLTTGKTVFKSKARGPKGRIGLSHIDSYSSKEGIPVYKDHEYDLISVYNNPTGVNQDAMATMFIYALDKEFKKPVLTETPAPVTVAATPSLPKADSNGPKPHVVFHTTGGDLLVELYPDVAPKTVEQILKLVNAGIYNTVRFYRLEDNFVLQTSNAYDRTTPLTDGQRALIQKVPGEFSDLKHERGVLSMARETNDVNSGESSFSFLLNSAPHLDGKYTVFGRIIRGWDVLKNLESAPHGQDHQPTARLEIVTAEVVPVEKSVSKLKLAGPKPLPKAPASSNTP